MTPEQKLDEATSKLYRAGVIKGAAAERAAIVTWLRQESNKRRFNQYSSHGWDTLTWIADKIERGEHEVTP